MTANVNTPSGDSKPEVGGIETTRTRREFVAIAAATAAATKGVIAGAPETDDDPYAGEVLADEDLVQAAFEVEMPFVTPEVVQDLYDVDVPLDDLERRLDTLVSGGRLSSKTHEGETMYWPTDATLPELQGWDR